MVEDGGDPMGVTKMRVWIGERFLHYKKGKVVQLTLGRYRKIRKACSSGARWRLVKIT